MQEELNFVKDLFSSMGASAVWAIVAFMVYKLSFMGFVTYGINQSIRALVKLLGTDIPKTELIRIKNEYEEKAKYKEEYIAKLIKESAEKQAELERVIHMHKMMKEAKDVRAE